MRTLRLVVVIAVAAVAWGAAAPASHAAAALTVEVITWNVIGLDSNDVSTGPATYPVGVRVCNAGSDPATAVVATFTWTTANAAIALDGPAVVDLGSLGAGVCRDGYWHVAVTRATSSYGATRAYEVAVTSAEGATASTPAPRELYVEELISQQRNSVIAITGPTTVTVGDEVTYTVEASTAVAGFEQLEAFLTLPPSIFRLLRVGVTYAKPAGATNDTMYADACGWDDVPTSGTYRTCVGPEEYEGGKVGGRLVTTYTVQVVGPGTADLSSGIYDKSGLSYHYNADFTVRPNLLRVTATAPPVTTLATVPTTTVPATTVPDTTVPAPPATTTTTAGVSRTASGTPVAATGRGDTGPLSLLGAMLVTLGLVAVGSVRVVEPRVPATPFERSVHDLRRALHQGAGGNGEVEGWRMMEALDRVAKSLREDREARG